MTRQHSSFNALVLLATLLACAAWHDARACACCTSPGERFDDVMPLDSYYSEQLRQIRFGETVKLHLGEAEPETVQGITTPSDKYEVQAAWRGKQLIFTLRDKAGRSGQLIETQPKNISVFRVDPRPQVQPEPPRGPPLYVEWRLTSKAAGAGVFAVGTGARQSLTLVLQGSGNNCSAATDFTHWMLVMDGPKAKYHFFGELIALR